MKGPSMPRWSLSMGHCGESGQQQDRKSRRAESHRAGGGSAKDPEGERGEGWDHRWAGSSGDEVRAARWTSGRPLLCAGHVCAEVPRGKGVSNQAS